MKRSAFYPVLVPDTGKVLAVGLAGGAVLTGIVQATGLDQAMVKYLGRWLKP